VYALRDILNILERKARIVIALAPKYPAG